MQMLLRFIFLVCKQSGLYVSRFCFSGLCVTLDFVCCGLFVFLLLGLIELVSFAFVLFCFLLIKILVVNGFVDSPVDCFIKRLAGS